MRNNPVVTAALVTFPVLGVVAFAKLWPGSNIAPRFEGPTAISEAGVLSAPGKYVLTADIASPDAKAITIAANLVELDLNGRSISCGLEGNGTETVGIDVSATQDVTIRNGAIRNCATGVRAVSVDNLAITGVDFSETRYIGAQIGGENSRVTNSVFAKIGGDPDRAYAIGINVTSEARNCLIQHNTFKSLYRQREAPDSMVGEGVAVIVGAKGMGCRIHQNTIINERSEKDTIGFWIGESATATITDNTVIGFERGIVGTGTIDALGNVVWLRSRLDESYGIYAQSGSAEGNLVVGYANPIASALASPSNVIQRQLPAGSLAN